MEIIQFLESECTVSLKRLYSTFKGNRQTDRDRDGDGHRHGQRDRETERQRDRETDRLTD